MVGQWLTEREHSREEELWRDEERERETMMEDQMITEGREQ